MENIPLFKIYWDERDLERVNAVIRKGMYWAIGPEIKEFESVVAQFNQVKYALAVNSGTSALHVILAAHGIGKGDEVIVPSFTFIATTNAPLFVGAKPVFAEIENKTYGLDPEDVERKITARTKAILPVHVGGSPCNIQDLASIARKHNLILIEDAAESIGASINNKKVGSFGDSAILSFCGPKIVTTGEGGVVLTNSRDLYEKARLIYNHGRVETTDYFSSTEQMQYVTLGYNFRMSTMTAALGIAQMEKIDDIIRMRRQNAERYTDGLSKIPGIITPTISNGYFQVYQIYTIRLEAADGTRDRLKNHLARHGIMSKVYFDPVHLTKFYREQLGHKEGELPETEKISKQVLTLPMYPELKREEIDYIVKQIADFMKNE
jgi:perosamine synthetase